MDRHKRNGIATNNPNNIGVMPYDNDSAEKHHLDNVLVALTIFPMNGMIMFQISHESYGTITVPVVTNLLPDKIPAFVISTMYMQDGQS